MGARPNIYQIKLLPIFSILLVHTGEVYEYGLYCGPHYLGPHVAITPGAIRACVKSISGAISIFTTQDYKCVSEGYKIDINPSIDRGLIELMRHLANTPTDPIVEEAIVITDNLETIEDVEDDSTAIPTNVQPVDPLTKTADNFRSKRLRKEAPEFIPPYTPAHGLLLNPAKAIVPSQTGSELRGDSTGLLGIEIINQCFFGSEVNSELPTTTLPKSCTKSWLKREKKREKKSKLLATGLEPSGVPPTADKQQFVSLMANGVIDIDTWRSVATECGYQEPDKIYQAHLVQADCMSHYYMDYETGNVYQISEETDYTNAAVMETITSESILGFKAVVGPKSFSLALSSPKWGVPGQVEKSTITDGPMIRISEALAKDAVNKGANLLRIFPVYEEKEKEGKTVYKVRLVIDGSKHTNHGNTYAETPTRDEFRIFMHIIGHYDWEFYHVDEKRAFLSAKHSGPDVIARLQNEFYKVVGALYGLKTAPRDYQQTVIERLVNKMGYKRFGMCSCIYCKKDETTGHMIYVFDFVDDFIWSGPVSEVTLAGIEAYKVYADTTPTLVNPSKVLGMELERNREDRTITLSLNAKIEEMMEYIRTKGLMERYNLSETRMPRVPLSLDQVIIGDQPFEEDPTDIFLASLCNKEEITEYLTLVGGHQWQLGVRWEVLYAVLYLSWQTHKPRHHHVKCAVRLVMYMYATRETNKLVLGGKDEIKIITYTDMSLNTGPNGKSVIGYGTRLGAMAGLVCGKCKATVDVVLSSFEGELEGVDYGQINNERVSNSYMISGLTEGFKQAAGIQNILMELNQEPMDRQIYSDNEAMVRFVNGEAQGKGMKHASLRLWYMRQQVERGYKLDWMSGKEILANPMTKAVYREEQEKHVFDVMGHGLRGRQEKSEMKELEKSSDDTA
jgi:hypothetical protein